MKIFFYALREFDELDFRKGYSEETKIDFSYTTKYPSLDNAALAQGADAVSMTPCDMSADMVEAFHAVGIKYITCRSIGYDHVDLKRAAELGMRVSNVSYEPNGVANYAIMLMLMCSRKFAHIAEREKVQDYSLQGKIGCDISSLTIGIIGTGRIGATVAKHLSGFGSRLLAYDPYENVSIKELVEYVPLDILFAQSDIITLHMNATEENYHLICKSSIAKMKKGVIIINTARGKLIDSNDLIEGIEKGTIGGAGLDVLENENGLYYYNCMGQALENRDLAELRSFPNVILSPHTAFYTNENVADMVKGCFESVRAFTCGERTEHEVVG